METVDSPNSFVVRTFSTPFMSMQPLMISSPSFTSRGRLSPVSALVFRLALPLTTTPSSGTFQQKLLLVTLPTATSSEVITAAFNLLVSIIPGRITPSAR